MSRRCRRWSRPGGFNHPIVEWTGTHPGRRPRAIPTLPGVSGQDRRREPDRSPRRALTQQGQHNNADIVGHTTAFGVAVRRMRRATARALRDRNRPRPRNVQRLLQHRESCFRCRQAMERAGTLQSQIAGDRSGKRKSAATLPAREKAAHPHEWCGASDRDQRRPCRYSRVPPSASEWHGHDKKHLWAPAQLRAIKVAQVPTLGAILASIHWLHVRSGTALRR